MNAVDSAGSAEHTRVRVHTVPRMGGRTFAAWSIWTIFIANLLVLATLWLRGGGITGVHSSGDFLTSLGRITGLLAAYLALLQVLLLSRLPWLERITGFDRLTVWHRVNGKLCLYLVLGHTVLTTVGYALNDRISIPAEASVLLRTYPGMVTATVGTGLFLVVVVSSLVIVYRRLTYEAWYVVHLTAYGAIALAWFHQIPTGNEFITNPAAAAYWRSLYAITLVVLILFRVVQPVVRGLRFRLRVEEVITEGPDVVSLRITGHQLDRLGGLPGQFFLWRFLTPDRWWESHPFSLSAAPDGKSLRITVKQIGDFTRRMSGITPGTMVSAEGPFGLFTDQIRRNDRVILIAGGIGITPIRALLESMVADLVLIYRVLRNDDIIFQEELAQLARSRNIRLHYVVGDHRAPGCEHLMSPEHLRSLCPDIAEREAYICGPPAMSAFIEHSIRGAGVPSQCIHTERFALAL